MALFEFGDYSYQEITLKEKLLEVLSYLLRIGDFKQYAGKTILNNVYMDLRGKKPVFKRTKTAMERNNIFATIRRYAKKLKPQYNGDVYLETVRCYFDISQENLEKCRYTYQGNETYAFLMSDKYIMALYTHCLVTRKKAAMQGTQIEGFTEKEYGMVRLTIVYTMALAWAPFGVSQNSQFLRPTVNGRIAFSLRLLEKLQRPSSR